MDRLYLLAHKKTSKTHAAVHDMKTQHDYWQVDHDRTMEEMKKHSAWQASSNTELPMNNITCLAGGEEMLRVKCCESAQKDSGFVVSKSNRMTQKRPQCIMHSKPGWLGRS